MPLQNQLDSFGICPSTCYSQRSCSLVVKGHMLNLRRVIQKGEDAAVIETKKKEMEAKRAAAASCKGAKVYYKITVRV